MNQEINVGGHIPSTEVLHPWDKKCLIEQLTTDEPKNHALCGVFDTTSECMEGYAHCTRSYHGEEFAEEFEDLLKEVETEGGSEESHE